jgi:hypothetical protein
LERRLRNGSFISHSDERSQMPKIHTGCLCRTVMK